MNLESRYSTTLRYLRYCCISALHQMGTIIQGKDNNNNDQNNIRIIIIIIGYPLQ